MSGLYKCDECKKDENLIFDHKHDEYVCSECGLVYDDLITFSDIDAEIANTSLNRPNTNTNEIDLEKIHATEYINAVSVNYDFSDNTKYGKVKIPENGFLGEDKLIEAEGGKSPNTHRDRRATWHYCQERKAVYFTHTIWWINPTNYHDKRWYCLACSKNMHPDFGAVYTRNDLKILEHIHRNDGINWMDDSLYKMIKNYLKQRKNDLEIRDPMKLSEFHNEPYNDDKYLITDVWTAISAISAGHSYTILKRGGRPHNFGAKYVTKWCNANFKNNYKIDEIGLIIKKLKINNNQRFNILTSNIVKEKFLLESTKLGRSRNLSNYKYSILSLSNSSA
jgi:hypothetical protein